MHIILLAMFTFMVDCFCPVDEKAYLEKKGEFNCTDNRTYHCSLTANGLFTEYCFEDIALHPGECPILISSREGILSGDQAYLCPNDCNGCPNEHYVSSELYKYPACYNVKVHLDNDSTENKLKVSVNCPEEKHTTSPFVSTTVKGTSLTPYSSEKPNTVQETNLTSYLTVEPTYQGSNSFLFFAVTITSMLLCLILISFCCYKKIRSTNDTIADIPLEINSESTIHDGDSHNRSCSSAVCHSETLTEAHGYQPCHSESENDEILNHHDTAHKFKFALACHLQKPSLISEHNIALQIGYSSTSQRENFLKDSTYMSKSDRVHHDVPLQVQTLTTVYDEVGKCASVVTSDSSTPSVDLCDEDDTYYHLQPRRNLPI